MNNYIFPAMLMLLLTCFANVSAQDIPVRPRTVKTGTFIGISKPLRDIPPMSKEDYALMEEKAKRRGKNTPWDKPVYPFASTAQPKGPDAAWQKSPGRSMTGTNAPLLNFEGQSSPYYPPDCNGAAGPNHFMQTVNTTYAIYSKTGTLLAGPTNMNLLFGSVTGATYNDGDPVILFDEQANRWFATEFSVSGTNDYMLFAVSTTSDPTGTWYQYSFDVVDMPDYEKVAVWRDGYYMGTNTQPTTGNDIYVFERSQMLIGGAARMVAFDNPYRPGTGVVVVPPVDNDGVAAPAGTPGTFIAFNDDGIGGGTDQLWIYELAVNWTTPANSTFNRTQQLAVTPFDTQFNNWEDIDQPGTTRNLCAISTVIMNVPQYRNFGTYQSIVCCHTVDVDATNHAGVRWYELRKTPPATTWTIRQQGTYAPDAHSRWMGAISMNGSGKIAVGYSISSSTVYPGIRYTGQSAVANASASGVLDIPEETALTGTNFQTTYNRWGDYASMAVDPSDDQTFWFTTEYIGASEARKTKIISFKLGNSPTVATLDATAVTASSATINGTVNPNGLATTYKFEWGTTVSYGNTTTITSAGSGSTAVAVSANLTGLTAGLPYHFRIVAVNTDGTSNGSDLTFTPGMAMVTTTAASSITMTTATAGGAVTTDGGASVTARGVCWSTTANPTISGSHTTDGSGTGSFTSSLTGLVSSTIYHIRAYATNMGGTVYGNDLTFTTVCALYTLPFTQSFSTTTIPPCWSQVDNQGSGQVWQFGVITGYSPAPALNGNYAFLNSDAYGSGNTQNADLVTPTLNLSGYTTVNLAFNHYFRSYSGSSGKISYSINNGSTWTLLTTITTTTATNPTAYSQAVNAVAGQSQVKFKWNYTGTWAYYWGIDDINITGTCTAVAASVAIAASLNPVCAGSGVTFTATPTNGGTTPAYQWKMNGVNAGTNSTTYSYTPANSDAITCVLTSNASCVTGSPATSNTITMTVNPLLPAGISIAASANPVESGLPVTITATATNGGSSPSYQWLVNGSNTGTNISTFTYIPANGDAVSCILSSSETCTSTNPANSNSIIIVVNSIASIVSLQNISVNGTECYNANQTITVAGGASTFTVQNNGHATMIAGQNILYYPGTLVDNGGYLYGYIAPWGPWCMAPAMVNIISGEEDRFSHPEGSFMKIYPNPTSGMFFMELFGLGQSEKARVEIYGVRGDKVLSYEFSGKQKYEISLNGFPEGIYLIHVLTGKYSATDRIILQVK